MGWTVVTCLILDEAVKLFPRIGCTTLYSHQHFMIIQFLCILQHWYCHIFFFFSHSGKGIVTSYVSTYTSGRRVYYWLMRKKILALLGVLCYHPSGDVGSPCYSLLKCKYRLSTFPWLTKDGLDHSLFVFCVFFFLGGGATL